MKTLDLRFSDTHRTATPVAGAALWRVDFHPTARLIKAAHHHAMICSAPDAIRLDDLDPAQESALWAAASACRADWARDKRAARILTAVNDGPRACQSVAQVHAHIIALDDLPRLRGDFAAAVRSDLPAAATPLHAAPPARTLLASTDHAHCYREARGRNAGPHHLVITAAPAKTGPAAESTIESAMWSLQRHSRRALRRYLGADIGFSVFRVQDINDDDTAEIHIVPRDNGLHRERGLTDIVRRHFIGLPYCVQEPVKQFLRRHPTMADGFMALRRNLIP